MALLGMRAVQLAGLQMSASGDAERARVIAELYRQHVRFIWGSVRRLGVRASSLDDAVQDVFLVAHRKLHDFQHGTAHKAWLFAIAVRVAAEHRRRDSRLLLDPEASASTPHLETTLALRRRIDLLDRALETLNDEQRPVFIMAEIEQFTVPEIAEALGVKLNTVYSRLRLARTRFERALARLRPAPEGA